jgi:hypothetical protein
MRIQREGAQLQPRGMWSAGPGDDQARFLADLRALRDAAAIGYDELAARAHYPSDILKEAENGPYLPTLPILAAYVRACDGDVLEWEERWRRVANEAAGDPGLPVRPAGASPAAVAGARAGVGVVPPDAYDPERIKAALRGAQSSDQGPAGVPGTTASAARDRAGWSFADVGTTGLNTTEEAAGWGAAGRALDTTGTPPPAGWDSADAGLGLSTMEAPAAGWTAATDDPAAGWGTRDGGGVDSAGWGAASPGWDTEGVSVNGNHEALNDQEVGQDSVSAWPGLPETELEPWSPGAEAAPPESASAELAWPGLPDAEPAEDTGGIELTHPSPTGAELGCAEVPTADAALTRAVADEPVAWNGAGPAVSGQAQVQVASARLQAVDPAERPADRFYPLRLLVIIVIAALIGSGLVLLLK